MSEFFPGVGEGDARVLRRISLFAGVWMAQRDIVAHI